MVTAIVVLLSACALFMLEQWSSERVAMAQSQAALGQTLAQPLGSALGHGDEAGLAATLGELSHWRAVEGAEVRGADGAVLARYGHPFAQNGAKVSTTVTPLVGAGPQSGAVLVVRQDLDTATRFLPRTLALTGALFFAAMGLSLFLGRMLARRVVEPVNRLSEVMQRMAASPDLSRRVQRAGDDEIGVLTDSFNSLLDRLQAHDRELRVTFSRLEQAKESAEEANLQKSQFLANMSHEIRTPLNGVLAMAQVMDRDELNDAQRERLSVIRGSGQTLFAILNDILDVSKIEAGKLELDPVDFDVAALVDGVRATFSAVAEDKGLAFDMTVAPEACGMLRGDPVRLRQILCNLVSNGLKFTEQGGVQVRIEAAACDDGPGLRFEVADTGIGIAPEKMSLLFQKFSQLDASTTRRFGGTGLGLSICYELTRMMGGRIWAQERPGGGSVFQVVVPLAAASPGTGALAELGDQEDADSNERPMRILGAEDNATNQQVLRAILEMFGAELTLVEDGHAAVETWRTGDFDLILMDIQMPVMDGIAATRAIRGVEAAEHRRRTPILALSANAMAHQVESYMAAGMDGHVAKPIELARLHEALQSVFEQQQVQSQAA